jgi:nickel-dependent lactate racemase
MKSHQVPLLYGKTTCDLSLPQEYVIHEIHKEPSNPLPDSAAATRAALRDPVSMPPLSKISKTARSACILVSDITRPTPNGAVLPHIMADLEEGGISRDNVTILIATGLHRRFSSTGGLSKPMSKS